MYRSIHCIQYIYIVAVIVIISPCPCHQSASEATPTVLEDAPVSKTTPPAEDDEEAPGNEEEDNTVKPPYSYAQLIVQALLASPDHRQTLSGIYSFISDKYPYYKIDEKGWKVALVPNVDNIVFEAGTLVILFVQIGSHTYAHFLLPRTLFDTISLSTSTL